MICLTREVSESIAQCELTHLDRAPIDLTLAREQHRRYEETLASLSCDVRRLPPLQDLPDAVFVEDAAVVLDELAILTRPGALSRRAEIPSVAEELRRHRPLAHLEAPATLDGGDVLLSGRILFVGLSRRTNREAARQLRRLAEPFGYEVREVEVSGCLHLKTAASEVAPGTLLVNRAWIDADALAGRDLIEVDPAEPFGANALLIGKTLVHAAAFPRTRARLESRGRAVAAVDVSEIAKAEGGLTCCSLIVG